MFNKVSHGLSVAILSLFIAGWGSDQLHAASPEFAQSPNDRTLRKSNQVAVIADQNQVMPITISPEASASVRKVAEQMAGILKKMTGREFSIQENTQPVGIVLGSLAQFPDKAVAKTLAKFGQIKTIDGMTIPVGKDQEGHPNWKGLEAYAIRTHVDSIRLLGQTEKGAEYAASRFLELLGMRRFSPSLAWEIIPKKTTLRFDADEESAPDYYVRDIWFDHGGGYHPKEQEEPMNPTEAWMFANRLGSYQPLKAAHIYQTVYQENKAEFDANKDKYYALVKGERKFPGKYCLSQPRVREMIVKKVMDQLAGKDGVRSFMASVEPSDGPWWCECDRCVAMGTPSERAAIVAQEAAKRAEELYPGTNMLGRLAYFQHSDPPSFEQPSNVLTLLATKMEFGSMAFPDLVEEWPKHSKTIGIYDYFSNILWGEDRLRPNPYAPAADPYALAATLRYYYDLGYRYLSAESMPNFAIYGPGYLMASDIMWDVKADENAIMEDFYEKSFGPAKEPVRNFYDLMNPSSGRLVARETFASLIDYLDQATTLAAKHPDILARIDQLKFMIIHNYYQYNRGGNEHFTADPEGFKESYLKDMSFVYRTRFDWISHAKGLLTTAADSLAKKFDDPSWKSRGPKNPAKWQENAEPVSADELALLWKEVKDFFGPAPKDLLKVLNKRKAEAKNLRVIVDRQAEKPKATSFSMAAYSGTHEVYFLSEQGESLKLNLMIPKANQENGRQVLVVVTDHDGKRIDRKRIQADQEEKNVELEVKLPSPGVYGVKVDGIKNARISPSLDQRFFIRSLDSASSNPSVPGYFYVPKNLTELKGYVIDRIATKSPTLTDPFALTSSDHTDWTVAPDEFGYFSLPIPEDDRGTIWSTNSKNIYFTSIPNLFTKDPGYVVVPDSLKED